MFTLVKSAFCTYAFFTKKQWNDVSTVTFHYTYSKEVHCWLTNKYHVNKEGGGQHLSVDNKSMINNNQ